MSSPTQSSLPGYDQASIDILAKHLSDGVQLDGDAVIVNGEPKKPKIKRKFRREAHYFDPYNDIVFKEELHQTFREQKYGDGTETKQFEDETAIVLITRIHTFLTKSETNPDAKRAPPITQVLGQSLLIKSRAIINALQSIVGHYPGTPLTGDKVTIEEPYQILVHHEEEIDRYRAAHAPGASLAHDVCRNEVDVFEDLGLLQQFMREEMGDEIEAERKRHARGCATFKMLWLLFKPGIDVYCDQMDADYSYWNMYVVHDFRGGMYAGKPSHYSITIWSMNYDGTHLGRSSMDLEIHPFEGEREISSFHVVPCQYFKDLGPDGKPHTIPIRERLVDRGKRFVALTKAQCLHYRGLTVTYPRQRYEGLAIVDQEELFINEDSSKAPTQMSPDESGTGLTSCGCEICVARQKSASVKAVFADYNEIENPWESTKLTPHHYALCTYRVHAFHCKTRSWQILNIDGFEQPEFDTGLIDRVVMDEDRRKLIKNLTVSFTKNDRVKDKEKDDSPNSGTWTASSVKGKGSGLIMLLHGKPGIGKTLTAECVAEHTKRPLLSLSCADIGTNPSDVQNNLTRWFQRGKLWGAVVLIDEADVYMERRITQDLDRNALVAGFLRALEYFEGILFLTTNRVGSFDDAFVSRIHVSLYYSDFSDADRIKVWNTFFDKLNREREETIRIHYDLHDYVESKEIRALKWNGREIGNAFQTAVALAEIERELDRNGRIVVKPSHLKQIVSMSQDFKRYLTKLHKGDEAKRAERERSRIDNSESESDD